MALTLAQAAERDALIIQRRSERLSFRVIGEELGIATSTVHHLFHEAVAKIPAEAVHQVRVEESELADRAIMDLLSMAENRQVSPRTRAECWNSIRGWSESKRKLLGADAPTRREITVVSAETVDNAIAELNKEMARMEEQAKAAGIKANV